jgi:hypothetical protein
MLRQKLATLKMEPGEEIAMYISQARDLRRDLMQAGLDATEVDLAAACGLSREFREIRMMLEYQADKISLDQMLPMLLQHEARLEKDDEDEGERTISTAFAAKGRRSNWKWKHKNEDAGFSKKDLKCYSCGEKGHKKVVCPSNSESEPQKNEKKRESCGFCGKKGHTEDDSRRKKNKNGNAVAFTISDGAGENESWLLDSGASHHLTGDRSKLTNLKTVADGLNS